VDEGAGEDLIRLPHRSTPSFVSAATELDIAHTPRQYKDFFGTQTPDAAITRVTCPVLAFFGSKDDIGGEKDLALLASSVRRLAHGPARVDTAMIANGNHEYVGEEAQVAQVITRWIETEVEAHRTDGISIPEAELRNQFAENPDGTVGSYKIPGNVPKSIMEGDHKHDYSQIRVPVLALVGFPEFPQDQIQKNHVMDPADRIIVEAVFGTYVGMTKHRIERIRNAIGGAHVVELWGANHFVFLSNEADVLREMTAFLPTLR
jgi:hypothetical protein